MCVRFRYWCVQLVSLGADVRVCVCCRYQCVRLVSLSADVCVCPAGLTGS